MESDIKAFIGAGLCAKLNDALTDYDPDDIDAGALSLWRDGDDHLRRSVLHQPVHHDL